MQAFYPAFTLTVTCVISEMVQVLGACSQLNNKLIIVDSFLLRCMLTSAVALGVCYGVKDVLMLAPHSKCTVDYFLPFFFLRRGCVTSLPEGYTVPK